MKERGTMKMPGWKGKNEVVEVMAKLMRLLIGRKGGPTGTAVP